MLSRYRSCIARKVMRPMRPNPLMPTRTGMMRSLLPGAPGALRRSQGGSPQVYRWACRRARESVQRVVEKREGTGARDATAPTARFILVDSAMACQLDEPGALPPLRAGL